MAEKGGEGRRMAKKGGGGRRRVEKGGENQRRAEKGGGGRRWAPTWRMRSVMNMSDAVILVVTSIVK